MFRAQNGISKLQLLLISVGTLDRVLYEKEAQNFEEIIINQEKTYNQTIISLRKAGLNVTAQ
ncbi:MAG: hypothetical protein DRP08_01615 [Candidatus Aenigmatarchaeota archaeon]|nr:MAG: hypothetical protein DRP08_01615 [Candidatus Aenigmarchaeota archaeon]